MRVISSVLVAALIVAVVSPVGAQTTEPPSRDALTFDVGAGVSRGRGPHAFAGLERAFTRWLALRGEGLFSLHSRAPFDASTRNFATSLGAVIAFRSDTRISPYLFGGYTLSLGQGTGGELGPLGAAGLRFRIGRVQPFIEFRAQHRLGAPLSFGFRF